MSDKKSGGQGQLFAEPEPAEAVNMADKQPKARKAAKADKPEKAAKGEKTAKGEKAEAVGTPEKDEKPGKPEKAPKAEKGGGVNAEQMAKKQREISVSEFFTKNRHLLGFDSPRKALLTAVKEAVDNSLDACEEARILPDVRVKIARIGQSEKQFTITVEDNGPGIVKAQVPHVFGRLLYGSKFHRLRQSRGQQGIGISAAGMYGLLTTGNPVRVRTKPGRKAVPLAFEIRIDTAKNRPDATDKVIEWDKEHGTEVAIDLEGEYRRG
jgi:DNA topoisomerase-6 subunit B